MCEGLKAAGLCYVLLRCPRVNAGECLGNCILWLLCVYTVMLAGAGHAPLRAAESVW